MLYIVSPRCTRYVPPGADAGFDGGAAGRGREVPALRL
jgi:hypothetical protein